MEFGEILHTFTNKYNKEVEIQTVQESDLELLLTFINGLIQEDTYIYRETDKPVTLEEERLWLQSTMQNMANNNQHYFVAKVDGRIVGVANVTRGWMREKEQGTIRLSVSKDYREQGIGTELLRLSIDVAKKMDLRVLKGWLFADDSAALYISKKLGFVEVGRIPQSIRLKDGYTDEILMYRKLNDLYLPQYGIEEDVDDTPTQLEKSEEDIV